MDTKTSDPVRILKAACEGGYEEKKSRFLAELIPVKTEEEAAAFFQGVRKKYYDARHHCTALILGPGRELVRSSDDGEPSGTAGKPMLEVLSGAYLTDVACVVTRYFGGTLLGTGGLVRAYSSAVKDALSNAEILTIDLCVDLSVTVGYPEVTPLQYYITQNSLTLLETEYLENVRFRIRIRSSEKERIEKELTELTKGKGEITLIKEGYEAI